MISKRFVGGVAICFCVIYVMFLHLESSYSYYDQSKQNRLAVSSETDSLETLNQSGISKSAAPSATKHTNYPYQSPTAGHDSFSDFAPKKSKRIAVILNCEGRSGSTWLSSFFWKNPNVFYTYEPLYPSSKNSLAMEKAKLDKEEGKQYQLADGFKCNLDYSREETFFPMVLGRYPMYQPELKHCEESNTCPESLTEFCKSRSHMVQKVIRVFNISDYQLLQKQLGPDIPLKIIHLVRDPRPHIISREKLFNYMLSEDDGRYAQMTPSQKSSQRRQLCLRELDNLKIGDSDEFDKDSYIRLSHEEMSLDPIKWAKKLYEFTGLTFTETTAAYINEITHGSDLVHGGKDPDGRFAGFSVYRDTLTILYKWKKADPRHIRDIEIECKELLDYLGYVDVYNDDLELINENPWPQVHSADET